MCEVVWKLFKYSDISIYVVGGNFGRWGKTYSVLAHSRRRFLRGVPSQFTEAHIP